MEEEIEELKKEIRTGDREQVAEEIGDILFAVANVSRLAHVGPEFALKSTTHIKSMALRQNVWVAKMFPSLVPTFGHTRNPLPPGDRFCHRRAIYWRVIQADL